MLGFGKAKENARLAAEAQKRDEALDPSVEIFTSEKKVHVAVLGFKVEKEQARLALEAQVLPISSVVYIEVFQSF